MALLQRYAIWNNKGGVGKSTITFHIASRYAEQYPHQRVLVIDLCPQANSSMMLLGGGTNGEQAVLNNCIQTVPRTVVGYLSQVVSGGAGAPLPDPSGFLTNVKSSNGNMPDNLFLLCGDGNLEPMAPALSGAAGQPALTPQAQPWRWIHLIFRTLVDDLVKRDPEHDWMVFIDTNPSFSIYTELAVSAADRLITPVNADDSSRIATTAMFILLHGQNPPHPIYGSWTFAARATSHGVTIPQIHLVVGNRLTQYGGAASAFGALSDATADELYQAYCSHPNYFTPRSPAPRSPEKFREVYSVPLRDFNTAGVVSAHLGLRLSGMVARQYAIHGIDIQVNKKYITDCLDAIDHVVTLL